MIKRQHGILFGLLTLLAPCMAAQAQDPGLGMGYLFGYGAPKTPLIRSFVPAPPYFSLHPPVITARSILVRMARARLRVGRSCDRQWDTNHVPAARYVAPVIINVPPAHMPMEAAPTAPLHSAPAAPAAPVNAVPSPVVIHNLTSWMPRPRKRLS